MFRKSVQLVLSPYPRRLRVSSNGIHRGLSSSSSVQWKTSNGSSKIESNNINHHEKYNTGNNMSSTEASTSTTRVSPSPSSMVHVGDVEFPLTSTLSLTLPQDRPEYPWPAFRMLDEDGHLRCSEPCTHDGTRRERTWTLDDLLHPSSSSEAPRLELPLLHHAPTALRVLECMLYSRAMDSLTYELQRQGRISFTLSHLGEEAALLGPASALDPHYDNTNIDNQQSQRYRDVVLGQYREATVLLWRGFTVEQCLDQALCNADDLAKGRQMPMHYGSKDLNFHTIAACLGTQIPQAVGVAHALQKFDLAAEETAAANAGGDNEAQEEHMRHQRRCALVFFGDGASSTPDFHSALNFASTLSAPVIFLCRNNGYAISTPVTQQYQSDGIVSRAPGYGVAGIRVDGNDVLAMHTAMVAAKRYATREKRPVLVEAVTYRVGSHSTSDDASKYRRHARDYEEYQNQEEEECEVHGMWKEGGRYDPVLRWARFLYRKNWLVPSSSLSVSSRDGEEVTVHAILDELQNMARNTVLEELKRAGAKNKPELTESMFADVYHDMPQHLKKQKKDLVDHVRRHGSFYNIP